MSIITLNLATKTLNAALTDQEFTVVSLAIQDHGPTFLEKALAYHIQQAQQSQLEQAKATLVEFVGSASPGQLAALASAMNTP